MKSPEKRGSTGVPYGLVVGLIAVVALAATQNVGGSINGLFSDTSETLGNVANEANNALPEPSPADTDPDAFDFADISDSSASTQIESAIVQITGISEAVSVSVAGDGSPEFRICDDGACSSVAQPYGSSAQDISPDQYLQLRLTSSSSYSTASTASVSVGNGSDDWTVTTGTAPVEIIFRSDYNGVQVYAYPYSGSSQTLTWQIQHDVCAANNAYTPGSTWNSVPNTYCSYSADDRFIVTSNCNWSGQSFTHVTGSIPGGKAGYMCGHIGCDYGKRATSSSMGSFSAGTQTINDGDYVFCSESLPSDPIVWQSTHGTYGTRVVAYPYTGSSTTLTWQLQHNTCQSYGKVTPGSTSYQSQYCAYSSSQNYLVTATCNWNSQGFNRISGTVPNGKTAYMCSHLNCDHNHRVTGTTRNTYTSTVTINNGDYVFCSP